MTGYQSKKAAALDEDGMYLVHQTASYADNLGKSIVALGKQTVKDIEQLKTQPEQEPVAMLERDPSIGRLRVTYEDAVTELDEGVYPLYTEPQGWRDNVAQAYLKGFDEGCKSNAKNASKPVAWLEPEWGEKICPEVGYEVTITDDHPKDLGWIPLAAQRTWVGLTFDEKNNARYISDWKTDYMAAVIEYIEAKLKEKNA